MIKIKKFQKKVKQTYVGSSKFCSQENNRIDGSLVKSKY